RKTLLSGLSGSDDALATSLRSLGTVPANQAVAASSSNGAVVSVTNTGPPSPAPHTIDSITSLASAASERSIASYLDSSATPVSSTGTVQLTVGSGDYKFTLANN